MGKALRMLVLAVAWAAFASTGNTQTPTEEYAEAFSKARDSATIAGYSLSKVQRWLHEEALPKIDEDTGLYIADGKWNYRDTAADCYPFLIWAMYAVEPELIETTALDILKAEQRLCNHIDRIPAPYDLDAGEIRSDISHDELVFQASEYVKDGLIAIIEVLGEGPWFERMKGIQEDLWKHADIETEFGVIPSKNVEVNGEQIQALTRMYAMTGEERFLEQAERLADYYLSDPDYVPRRLRDHGCEIIGGLGLLMAVESTHNPDKGRAYADRLRPMLDEVLERGTNDDGMMYNRLGKRGDPNDLSDGWGYNYVTYLCYDMVVGENHYRPQVERVLSNTMKPFYKDFRWEGSIDGYADSIEGALYLLNRVPVDEGFEWVDREMANNVVLSDQPRDEAELWGTMKLQSNAVRTTIMHALMHTQGIRAFPWRKDLKFGAAPIENGVAIYLEADEPWEGELVFDKPRHEEYMGFEKDWPRMNTLPEWFTVDADAEYVIEFAVGDDKGSLPTKGPVLGSTLRDGVETWYGQGPLMAVLKRAEK